MRRRAGIFGGELPAAVRAFRLGDCVRFTFLGGTVSQAAETLRVRVMRIRGDGFRGKPVDQPACRGLSGLGAVSAVAFTASHIPSVTARPRPSG